MICDSCINHSVVNNVMNIGFVHRFDLSTSVKDKDVKIELVRGTDVLRQVREEINKSRDKFCQKCRDTNNRWDGNPISCVCSDEYPEPRESVRQLSFTHYVMLSEGEKVFLKSTAGNTYNDGKHELVFSGEYIGE